MSNTFQHFAPIHAAVRRVLDGSASQRDREMVALFLSAWDQQDDGDSCAWLAPSMFAHMAEELATRRKWAPTFAHDWIRQFCDTHWVAMERELLARRARARAAGRCMQCVDAASDAPMCPVCAGKGMVAR